jgi:hypothetical protein
LTTRDYVLKPEENFRGMSYGDWAVEWSNWLYSDDPDRTDKFDEHMIFFRGNLDYYKYAAEGDIASLAEFKRFYNRSGDQAVTICKGAAIFVPVLTAMYFTGREYEGTTLSNKSQLRHAARKDNDLSNSVWATIQTPDKQAPEPIVDDLTLFRVESPVFKLKISDKNPFIQYILGHSPTDSEEYDAVTDGYFLILKSKSLPSKSCRIQFGGKGRGNYRTDAVYDIHIADCESPILVRDISRRDNKNPAAWFLNNSTNVPEYSTLPPLHDMPATGEKKSRNNPRLTGR